MSEHLCYTTTTSSMLCRSLFIHKVLTAVFCPGRHRIKCAMRRKFKLFKNISTMNSQILNKRRSFDRSSTLCLLTSDNCNNSEHETALDCAWQNIRWFCAAFSCVNFEWERVRAKYLSWFSFHSTGSYILASLNRDKVYWTVCSSFYCTKIVSNIFHINVYVSLLC